MLKHRDGFTLIELLIVVVIIGILAAIAIPKFSAAREKAYFSAMKSDLKNLASQQEVYYATDGEYAYSAENEALGFAASEGVNVAVAVATNPSAGWSATATHSGLASSFGCAIYFGDIAAPNNPIEPPLAGVVTCEDGTP